MTGGFEVISLRQGDVVIVLVFEYSLLNVRQYLKRCNIFDGAEVVV